VRYRLIDTGQVVVAKLDSDRDRCRLACVGELSANLDPVLLSWRKKEVSHRPSDLPTENVRRFSVLDYHRSGCHLELRRHRSARGTNTPNQDPENRIKFESTASVDDVNPDFPRAVFPDELVRNFRSRVSSQIDDTRNRNREVKVCWRAQIVIIKIDTELVCSCIEVREPAAVCIRRVEEFRILRRGCRGNGRASCCRD